MFKQFFLTLLLSLLVSTAAAQTFWLNIPGAYSKTDEQYVPAMSFPMQSHDSCSDAIVEYAKANLVYYIGCDVEPLTDAVNLKKFRKDR